MEDADFDDCGVHLTPTLEKYKRKLNQQPPLTPASRTGARKLARQTPSLSEHEQRAHEEKEKQHAETSKKLEEVRELLLASAKKQEQMHGALLASAKKQEQMQDTLINLEDRLEQMLVEQKAHQAEKEMRRQLDQAEKEMRM